MSLTSFLKTVRGKKTMWVRIGNWERTRRIKVSPPPGSRYLTEMGVGNCPPRGIRGHPCRACSLPPQNKWVFQHFVFQYFVHFLKIDYMCVCLMGIWEFHCVLREFLVWFLIILNCLNVQNLRVFSQTCLLFHKTKML